MMERGASFTARLTMTKFFDTLMSLSMVMITGIHATIRTAIETCGDQCELSSSSSPPDSAWYAVGNSKISKRTKKFWRAQVHFLRTRSTQRIKLTRLDLSEAATLAFERVAGAIEIFDEVEEYVPIRDRHDWSLRARGRARRGGREWVSWRCRASRGSKASSEYGIANSE